MAEQFALQAQVRTAFGKGAARKLRVTGFVPGVVYGHGGDTQHVALPAHELSLLVRHKNVLIDLDIAGKKELVLVKDVQKDYVRQTLEHVDLVIVRKGETVTVNIPVVMVGHSFPGTVAMLEHQTLKVEAEATHIPEHLEVDVLRERLALRVNFEDLLAALRVGRIHLNLTVETTGTEEGGVEDVGTVRRGDHDDVCLGVEPVHFDEQLVERLLALVVAAAEASAALAADGIDAEVIRATARELECHRAAEAVADYREPRERQ